MPSHNNLAIIAAAGSRKTEYVIDKALGMPDKNVLITTYTNENQRQIIERIQAKSNGTVPAHITVLGWFTFLVNECARPYQNAFTLKPGYMKSLNFIGERYRLTSKNSLSYFFDKNRDIYRNGVSDFACDVNQITGGKVIARLEQIWDHIFIDEVQDLVGFDLDLLDRLFDSTIGITLVGDPRQYMVPTNTASKYKKYKKEGLLDWFEERKAKVTIEPRVQSHRCNQTICDFADALFPNMPSTESLNTEVTGHDGIFIIPRADVAAYVATYKPTILRENKNTDTEGLAAINIGVSKGSTYDRVLIFPASTVIQYYKNRDLENFKSRERLYVAATRARFSATFVE
ncbi:MAG: helicase [Candidatus Saccharibacteria bacterium]|nr:helicase [Candidatus Saccharibacteria bacterium]